MEINIKWHHPFPLVDGDHVDLILNIEDLYDVYDGPGVYMFCRKYGLSIQPLYIGRSINVQNRIRQHLNSVRMMKGIQNARKGEKILVVGEFVPKAGQQAERAITIAEAPLIETALLENCELLNDAGTKRPTHQINFTGFKSAKNFSGSHHIVNA